MKNNFGNQNDYQGMEDTEDKNKFRVNLKSKYKSPATSRKNNNEGEYVDFTEIK